MVQANADGRPRSRRAQQSEEQAPLVESYLSSSGSTSYQGTHTLPLGKRGAASLGRTHTPHSGPSGCPGPGEGSSARMCPG